MGLGDRLEGAGVKLFHAANLRDLAVYLRRSAIVSRHTFMNDDPRFTPFWSDDEDRERGILDRVFGNLYDFAAVFARTAPSTRAWPQIYGPITLELVPNVFRTAPDIILTRQSAPQLPAGPLETFQLSDADVTKMLLGDSWGAKIHPDYYYTECSFGTPALAIPPETIAWVDPINIAGRTLAEWVRTLPGANILDVRERRFRYAERLNQLQGLADLAWRHQASERAPRLVFSPRPAWMASFDDAATKRFDLWVTNFYNGTVSALRRS